MDREPPRPFIVSCLWTVWMVAVVLAGVVTVLAILNWMGLTSDPLLGIYRFVKVLVH